VDAGTPDARAALALQHGEIVGVDAVAHAEHALSAAGARRDAARDRGGVERRQQRLLPRERVVLRGVVAEPSALLQPSQPPRDLARDALDFGVVGRGQRMAAEAASVGAGVDAVEHEGLEVDVEFSALPKRCTKVTAPQCPCRIADCFRARRRSEAKTQGTKTSSTSRASDASYPSR
jgi:hypothetical protein